MLWFLAWYQSSFSRFFSLFFLLNFIHVSINSTLSSSLSHTSHIAPLSTFLSIVPIYRSQRTQQPPSYLRDFHCQLVSSISSSASIHARFSSTGPEVFVEPDDLASYLSYDILSPFFHSFSLFVASHYEPFGQAVQ